MKTKPHNYELSRDAQRDIADITHYTITRWGDMQAQRYIQGLHKAMSHLADDITCRPAPYGLLRKHVQRHFIYYSIDQETAMIVAILHERMSSHNHLQQRVQ